MAQQRNNIAKLPPPLRDKVSALLYEGTHTQEEIEAAVRDEAIRLGLDQYAEVHLHGTSYLAWRESQDYRDYVAFARDWSDKVRAKRWAATALNEGRGPQSVADLAAMGILEQLHALAKGGLLKTGKDVATVARAIAGMQRAQLDREKAERDRRIEAIETEHAQALAAAAAELAAAQAEIARLGEQLAGSKSEDGLRPETVAEIERRMNLL